MAEVEAEIEMPVALADAWELYFDPVRWPYWVDGFGQVGEIDGYPEVGGTLAWQSNAAGRGAVTEQVLEHSPRSLHRISFTDPDTEGELETQFGISPGGEGHRTKVSLRLSYRLRNGGLFGFVLERVFVRPQMRRSLERSLRHLREQAAGADDDLGPGAGADGS